MKARIIRAAEAPQRPMRLARGTATDLVTPRIGSTAMDVHVNRLHPGAAPGPYHIHTNSENVYYVLAGRLLVRLDDVEAELAPGDAAFIPPGVPHSATNAGDEDAVLIEIYAPGRADFVEVPSGAS
jgi:mannose-6-phosphate isomerase-like protein (cupin superfamily)